jgi:putative ABC transport system permease protein
MSTIRGLASAIDPSLRVSARSLNDSIGLQMAPFRAIAWLSAALGSLALALASVGLYGVISFVVTQQRRDTGIRIALGAQTSDVIRLFLRQGLRLTTFGVICGTAGAVLSARFFQSVLIDLSPFDPVTFVCVSIFLFLVATVAILVPTRRATRVDPLVALRYE